MGAQPSTPAQGGDGGVSQRYYVQKVKLGAGSFGTVWRAVDRKTGQPVAMKQLDKAKMATRKVKRQDVEREMQMMRTCFHENLLRLFATFEEEKFIYLALEYCGDGDLADKIREKNFRLRNQEVVVWVRQICAAISQLHSKGVCHRDIKPENFMVSGELLKLADFGLAVFLPRGSLLMEKCGTPAFMAPEQHRLPNQSRGYGLPVDIWAAGSILFMLMSGGRHPFIDSRAQNIDFPRLMKGALDFTCGPELDLAEQVGEFFGFGEERLPDARFPDAAREVCQLMMQLGPSQRITADSVLKHPWLSSCSRTQTVAKQISAPESILKYPRPAATPHPVLMGASAEQPLAAGRVKLTPFFLAASAELPADAVEEHIPAEQGESRSQLTEVETGGLTALAALREAEQVISKQQLVIAQLQEEVADLRTFSTMTSSVLTSREAELDECVARLVRTQADCDSHDNAAENKRSELQAQEHELAQRDEEISRKDQQLAEQKAKLEQLDDKLSQCAKRPRWRCCRSWLPQGRKRAHGVAGSGV